MAQRAAAEELTKVKGEAMTQQQRPYAIEIAVADESGDHAMSGIILLEHRCRTCWGSGGTHDQVGVCPTCQGSGYQVAPAGMMLLDFLQAHSAAGPAVMRALGVTPPRPAETPPGGIPAEIFDPSTGLGDRAR